VRTSLQPLGVPLTPKDGLRKRLVEVCGLLPSPSGPKPDLRLIDAPLEVNPAAHYTPMQQPSTAEAACAAALSLPGRGGRDRRVSEVRHGTAKSRAKAELLSGVCAYRN
jgi:hypothetical protein